MTDDHHGMKRETRRIGRRMHRLVRRLAVVELCVFGMVAVASTWPLASHLRTGLPLGTEPAATVPLFTSWTVWWNCDRLTHLYSNYWDAPIFYDCPDTLAFSEPLPLTVVGAPVYWSTKSPAATGNTVLLFALTLNGWSAFRFFSRVHRSRLVAFLGGLMIELLPFVHHEIAVLQLVPLCGVIWTLHSLHHWMHGPSWFAAIATGGCCAVTYLLCSYYGLFLLMLLVASVPWLLGRRLMQVRTWCLAGVSAAIFLLLAAPVIRAQMRVTETYQLNRSQATVRQFSATLADYRAAPWQSIWHQAVDSRATQTRLFALHPGNLKVFLALLGAIAGLRYRRYRRWTAFSLAMLAASMLLSFGPGLQVGGWSLYGLLVRWIPGFAQVRSPFRFAVFVQLMIVQLSVIGLYLLLRIGRAKLRHVAQDRMAWLAVTAVIVVGVSGAVELWPPPQRIFRLPTVSDNTPWISWLRNRTPEGSVVACLPFPTGRSDRDFESTTLWMYAATYHKRPLVNGFSGFFPQSYRQLQGDMASFPSDASLRSLQTRGVDYCVIGSTVTNWNKIEPTAGSSVGLQRVFVDPQAQVGIYRLVTAPLADRREDLAR
ncbi:MAG: hypothetical protein ABI614_03005 [Planctomycetota bacterium]